MTIACTRCGATQDGDIIVPPLAFRFKHNSGCGHGVGPLAVLPSAKKVEKVEVSEHTPEPITPKEDVKIEESPKKSKPLVEKLKVFGKHNDTNTTNTTNTNTTT